MMLMSTQQQSPQVNQQQPKPCEMVNCAIVGSSSTNNCQNSNSINNHNLNPTNSSTTNLRHHQQAGFLTSAHDATFVCPSSSSWSSSSQVSICSYPTLKLKYEPTTSTSATDFSSSDAESTFSAATTVAAIAHDNNCTAMCPSFKPAALVRVATKPGQEDGAVLELNKIESTIGRDQCDHVIVSVEMSRKHALIKYDQARWWILDLNSTNGLVVNGRRVSPNTPIPLEDGNTICFGPENSTSTNRFIFQERYGLVARSMPPTQKFFVSSQFHQQMQQQQQQQQQQHFIPSLGPGDLSGYESSSTQEMLPPPPPPPPPACSAMQLPTIRELYVQLDYSRNDIAKLKDARRHLELELKKQKEMAIYMKNDADYHRRQVAEKEVKVQAKVKELDAVIAKYKTLCEQLQESQRVASQSQRSQQSSSSDDEQQHSSACSGFSQATVSSVLKEMTCSICSEYMVTPTSLNCSHVFCQHCIDEWRREYRHKYNSVSSGICPVCRKEVQCQTQVLVLENVINFVLEQMLDPKEKEDRAKLVKARKEAAQSRSLCPGALRGLPSGLCSTSGTGSGGGHSLGSSTSLSGGSTPSSLSSFIQELLNGVPRSRRRSIVITSDDSDDSDDDSDSDEEEVHEHDIHEGARRIRQLSDDEVVALDATTPAARRPRSSINNSSNSNPEVVIDDEEEEAEVLQMMSSDEEIEEEYDVSIRLDRERIASSNPRIALSLALHSDNDDDDDEDGQDSNDDEVEEILMLGDSSSDDSEMGLSDYSFASSGSSLPAGSGSEEDDLFLFDLDDRQQHRRRRTSSRSANNNINSQDPIVISDSEESQILPLDSIPVPLAYGLTTTATSGLVTEAQQPQQHQQQQQQSEPTAFGSGSSSGRGSRRSSVNSTIGNRRSDMIILSDSEESNQLLLPSTTTASGSGSARAARSSLIIVGNRNRQNGLSPTDCSLQPQSVEQAAPGGGIDRRQQQQQQQQQQRRTSIASGFSRSTSTSGHSRASGRSHPYSTTSQNRRRRSQSGQAKAERSGGNSNSSQNRQNFASSPLPRRATLCA